MIHVFDSARQRKIMGHFATGVTVVTTRFGEGEYWGITANAVLSLSLDPPLILVTVSQASYMRECLERGKCFAVNILKADQSSISKRFAARGPKSFGDLETAESLTGAPILAGNLAYIECTIVEIVHAGDHDIFIGQAVAGETDDGEPLIYYKGQYTNLVLPDQLPSLSNPSNMLNDPWELFAVF